MSGDKKPLPEVGCEALNRIVAHICDDEGKIKHILDNGWIPCEMDFAILQHAMATLQDLDAEMKAARKKANVEEKVKPGPAILTGAALLHAAAQAQAKMANEQMNSHLNKSPPSPPTPVYYFPKPDN